MLALRRPVLASIGTIIGMVIDQIIAMAIMKYQCGDNYVMVEMLAGAIIGLIACGVMSR